MSDWMKMRFRDVPDSVEKKAYLKTAAQKAIAENYDYLADNVSPHLAMAYLARAVGNATTSGLGNTGMAGLIGGKDQQGRLINDHGVGGAAGVEVFTIDLTDSQYGAKGRTLRLGKARPNWPRRLDSDTRVSYALPVADPTVAK